MRSPDPKATREPRCLAGIVTRELAVRVQQLHSCERLHGNRLLPKPQRHADASEVGCLEDRLRARRDRVEHRLYARRTVVRRMPASDLPGDLNRKRRGIEARDRANTAFACAQPESRLAPRCAERAEHACGGDDDTISGSSNGHTRTSSAELATLSGSIALTSTE